MDWAGWWTAKLMGSVIHGNGMDEMYRVGVFAAYLILVGEVGTQSIADLSVDKTTS